MSVENIKKVVASRIYYLTLSALSHRKKQLQSTQQLHKLTTKKMKSRYKNCAKTFGKSKSAAISKVEYTAYGCVTQVTSQHLIEQATTKKTLIGLF